MERISLIYWTEELINKHALPVIKATTGATIIQMSPSSSNGRYEDNNAG